MHILIIHTDEALLNDIRELSREMHVTPYVAHSHEEARSILAKTPVEVVFFALRTVSDLEFINYLNTFYAQVEVMLTVAEHLNEIVTVLREGTYTIMKTPFNVSEFQSYLQSGVRENRKHQNILQERVR